MPTIWEIYLCKEACKPWLRVKPVQRQHKSLGNEKLLHPFQTICMWEAETFHLYIYIYMLHNTSVPSHNRNSLCFFLWVRGEDYLPAREIPNFAAALGNSPRSMVPKDKRLFEYLNNWTSVIKSVSLKRRTVRKWVMFFFSDTKTYVMESSGKQRLERTHLAELHA